MFRQKLVSRQLIKVQSFILDHAFTSFQLGINEAFHIQREQPSSNQQLHLSISRDSLCF